MSQECLKPEDRDEENEFRNLAERSPEAIVVHSEMEILYVNARGVQLLGADSPQDCLGRSVTEFVRSEDRAQLSAQLKQLVQKQKARRLQETPVVRRDGRIVYLEWSVVPVRFQGRPCLQVVLRDIADRKRTEYELHSSREEYRRLSDHLEVVRELEKAEISREIHDKVGQLLAALMMDLSWLKTQLQAGPTQPTQHVSERMEHMSSILRTAMASIRTMTDRLRPALLDHIGLEAAIENQSQEFQLRTGIPCDVRIEPIELPPDRETALGLFRILQLALADIARQPDVPQVRIRLASEGSELVLTVSHSSGENMPESLSTSLDLLKIRERARKMGGRLHTSHSSDEVELQTRIPVD